MKQIDPAMFLFIIFLVANLKIKRIILFLNNIDNYFKWIKIINKIKKTLNFKIKKVYL